MRYGTSYFRSRAAAVRYYRDYHVTADNVDRKIEAGEIHIGQPPHKPGDRLRLIDNDTRWEIEEGGGG